MIIGSIFIFGAIADLVVPTSYYQTFEEYKMYAPKELDVNKSDSEIKAAYDSMVKTEKERIHDSAVHTLFSSIGYFAIPLPTFIMFNRIRKRIELNP